MTDILTIPNKLTKKVINNYPSRLLISNLLKDINKKGMDENPMKKLINKLFTTDVEMDGDNYKVNFNGKGGEYGYILFRKAKKGWISKPLSQGVYIVSDADIFQVIDTLSLYLSLGDTEISEFRKEFIDLSMDILDSYFLKEEGTEEVEPITQEEEGEEDTEEESDSLTNL